MRYLKTNTATIVTVGPFLDKTDGVTLETGLTITNERISFVVDLNDGSAPTLVLDNVTGATSGTDNDLNYIANCDAALMQLELSAANTNYLGRAFLTITDAANHCPVFHEFTILPAVVYDSLIAGTDVLQADMTQILGTAVSTPATAGLLDVNAIQISGDATAANNLEAACDGNTYNIGGGAVVAASVTGAVGSVTAGVTLADDAITAAKFDESTAYPLKNADTGATAVARTGADSDTLETLSDQIDGVPTTSDITTAIVNEEWLGGVLNKLGVMTEVIGLGSAGFVQTTIDRMISLGLVDTVGSVTNAVTVGTNNDKTGYSLTATTGLGNQTANITGNLSGSVGSVTGAVGSVTAEVTANMAKISGDSTAADRLEAMLDAMPNGAVVDDNDPDPTTTAFETNLGEATDDHYNGAFVVFTSGALLGQSRKISDYDGTTKIVTVATAFTESPAAADTFIILGRSE